MIVGGLALATLGYAVFLPVGADWTYAAMFPSMLLVGLAFALVYGPLTIVTADEVPDREQGLAGGLLYTSFQFGAALGLAAVTAVTIAATGDGTSAAAQLDGYHAGLVVPAAAVFLALLIGVWGLRRRRTGGGTGGAPAADGAAAGPDDRPAAPATTAP